MCAGCSAKTIEALSKARKAAAPTTVPAGPHLYSRVGMDKDAWRILQQDKELVVTLETIGGHEMVKVYLRVTSERRKLKLLEIDHMLSLHLPDQIIADLKDKATLKEIYRGAPRPS